MTPCCNNKTKYSFVPKLKSSSLQRPNGWNLWRSPVMYAK